MDFSQKQNANPTVFAVEASRPHPVTDDLGQLDDYEDPEMYAEEEAEAGRATTVPVGGERIDALEVFDLIRHLNDPEHPLTLEQLKVTRLEHVSVDHERSMVDISFTPTIPHCSMATLIGLCIRVKLLRSLPPRFKVNITITPGSHSAEAAVNKQLNDKERVAAALENTHLLDVVNKCLHVPRASS